MTHTEHSHDDSSAGSNTEHDFTVPKDADFTTPGEPMTDTEHRDTADEDGQGRPNATPGNPLGEEH